MTSCLQECMPLSIAHFTEKITEEIQNIMEKYGYPFGRASSIVLWRNKHLFDELLDQEESYTDGEDESEDININDEN